MPVDDFCADNDESGMCTACYKGYVLVGGFCQVANPFCKSHDDAGICTSCFGGYVLYKEDCTPLSKLADIALYYAECCPEKLA